jgi:hypothetical protein
MYLKARRARLYRPGNDIVGPGLLSLRIEDEKINFKPSLHFELIGKSFSSGCSEAQ